MKGVWNTEARRQAKDAKREDACATGPSRLVALREFVFQTALQARHNGEGVVSLTGGRLSPERGALI
jgi:hypothetical protein